MTLAFFRSLVQNELHSLDAFRAETETAMEEGLIRPVDAQLVQGSISILGQLMRHAVENGTEVGLGRGGLRDEDSSPGLSSLGKGRPASPDSPTLITREDGAT